MCDVHVSLLNKAVEKLLAVSENGKARTSRLATLFVKNLEKPNSMYKPPSEDKNIQMSTFQHLLCKVDELSEQEDKDTFLTRSYVVSVLFSYVMDLVVTYQEESYWLVEATFVRTFLKKGDEIDVSLDDALHNYNNDADAETIKQKSTNVARLLIPMLREIVKESNLEVMYRLDYDKYREQTARSYLDQIREELVQRAWHPKRLKWCLDYEEQNEIWGC